MRHITFPVLEDSAILGELRRAYRDTGMYRANPKTLRFSSAAECSPAEFYERVNLALQNYAGSAYIELSKLSKSDIRDQCRRIETRSRSLLRALSEAKRGRDSWREIHRSAIRRQSAEALETAARTVALLIELAAEAAGRHEAQLAQPKARLTGKANREKETRTNDPKHLLVQQLASDWLGAFGHLPRSTEIGGKRVRSEFVSFASAICRLYASRLPAQFSGVAKNLRGLTPLAVHDRYRNGLGRLKRKSRNWARELEGKA